MLGNSYIDYACQIFADQFVEDRDGPIYRRNQTGAPIRVTPEERAEFIATYRRHIRNAFWGLLIAMLGLVAVLFWWFPDSDSEASETAMMAGIAAIVLVFFLAHRWSWQAPSRDLERRVPEGSALTRTEARALALSKITYANLGLAVVFGIGLIVTTASEPGRMRGWGAAWLVFGVGLIALAGVQAFRKSRYERSRDQG